ncbi:UPF0262 family protein [Microvirga sp. W0021]|uniref:UPF0262 family protein n=1 Tax=Hohaiivirga grylli TaxID=3133970 RepID=A0ABV0BGV2_9HYPH
MGERAKKERLIAVKLDEETLAQRNVEQEHERIAAISDILADNRFSVCGYDNGPYILCVGIVETKLYFAVYNDAKHPIITHHLSLTPFRRVLRDYTLLCDSYEKAIKSGSIARLEAIDMGRRGLHNEAAEILLGRLKGKFELDFDTARRLFTLVFALYWKGDDV